MNNKKIIILVSIIILIIPIFTGCNLNKLNSDLVEKKGQEKENKEIEDEYGIKITDKEITFIDGRRKKVSIDKNPEKTVILFGSFLDIWTRNGGEMIGMIEPSAWMDVPNADNIEVVGKRGSISIENIVNLDPDLIIMSSNIPSDLDLIPALEQIGAQILAIDYTFKEDYFKTAKLFSAINNEEYLYEKEAEKIKKNIQNIINKIPEENNPSAAIILNTSSKLSLRTANTTIGQMFKDLKIKNIADPNNKKEGNLDFSLETILQKDPDYIFIQTMGSDLDATKSYIESEFESNPAWSSLKAVKKDNYIILPKDLYTYKANHNYQKAYKVLAETLYPEIFN